MNFKREFESFLQDIESNIKNSEDLEYINRRFSILINNIQLNMQSQNIDINTSNIENKEENKIEKIIKSQEEILSRMEIMEKSINQIQVDIYEKDEFDLEIKCPYCENNFIADIENEKQELECPRCKNIIELDWTEEVEKDYNSEEDDM